MKLGLTWHEADANVDRGFVLYSSIYLRILTITMFVFWICMGTRFINGTWEQRNQACGVTCQNFLAFLATGSLINKGFCLLSLNSQEIKSKEIMSSLHGRQTEED